MKSSEDKIKILFPRHETLNILGEMSYGESQKAWNLIRLKHDILKEFPQLKQRREDFAYKMIMHRNYKDLKRAITRLEKENLPIPIFLFLCKKDIEK